jgi:hypothetical protein
MRLSRPNQKGFISMEVFLIIVVLVLVGGTGYFVYQATKKTNDTFSAAAKAADSSPETKNMKQKSDLTSNWTAYQGSRLSFRYPSGWIKTACEADNVMLGPNEISSGNCNSDKTPEIAVYTAEGDKRADYHLETNYYPDLKKETVTVNGVTGYKESGTFTTPAGQQELIGPGDGGKQERYVFYSNGVTYIAHYGQSSGFTDELTNFDLLVTKTLSFK